MRSCANIPFYILDKTQSSGLGYVREKPIDVISMGNSAADY